PRPSHSVQFVPFPNACTRLRTPISIFHVAQVSSPAGSRVVSAPPPCREIRLNPISSDLTTPCRVTDHASPVDSACSPSSVPLRKSHPVEPAELNRIYASSFRADTEGPIRRAQIEKPPRLQTLQRRRNHRGQVDEGASALFSRLLAYLPQPPLRSVRRRH